MTYPVEVTREGDAWLLASQLSNEGWVRDIAGALHISPARVSQILAA
jgi:hypothetical protein